jgi:hypothetical protein
VLLEQQQPEAAQPAGVATALSSCIPQLQSKRQRVQQVQKPDSVSSFLILLRELQNFQLGKAAIISPGPLPIHPARSIGGR